MQHSLYPKKDVKTDEIRYTTLFNFHETSAQSKAIGSSLTPKLNKDQFLHHSDSLPIEIGIIHTKNPAFLNLQKSSDTNHTLYISSFDFWGRHAVKCIPSIGNSIKDFSSIKIDTLSRNIIWPNGVLEVSKDLLGIPGILVSGGFIPPMYSTGAITFVPKESHLKQIQITKPKAGWFYHKAETIDMNEDGKLDILTARAKAPFAGKSKGELLWLENPGDPRGEWKEHIIAKGPDVHFEILYLSTEKDPIIISSEFFNKRISITWKEHSSFKTRIIDDTLGRGFDLQIVDINKDGRPELLVTNHENPYGSVFVYEIPKDFKNAEWKRHTICNKIKNVLAGPHQAAPGSAMAFVPTNTYTGKPHIIVSGDGSTKAHLLIPKSENPLDFNYEQHILMNANCTVGKIAVADVNNDGICEIFIPAYEKNQIHVFTYPQRY